MTEMQKLVMYELGKVRTVFDYVLAKRMTCECEGDSRGGVCLATQACCAAGYEY